jgi:hypothetical protein
VSQQLSPHFTFDELTRTGQTALQAQNRKEGQAYTAELTALANMLEVIRAKFGPFAPTCAFRGPTTNAKVGGAKTSQHLTGEAADFSIDGHDLEDVFRWIVKESGLSFGQAIIEGRKGPFTWIHLSLGEPFREKSKCGQVLQTRDGKDYDPWAG